jgi:phosphoenolpyruvate---glycerone phosphotransferase subunit DhaL
MAISLAELAVAVADGVAEHRDELNRLDGIAGDGDLGLTAAAAAAALGELVATPEFATLSEPDAIRRIGREVASKAPSTAGTLVAFALMAAGKAVVDPAAPAASRAATYLRAAADTLAARGNVKAGDRTMLDALLPAVEALERGGSIGDAASAADAGAVATAAMAPTVGRAAWLADRARDHEDAGARLIAIAFAEASRASVGWVAQRRIRLARPS